MKEQMKLRSGATIPQVTVAEAEGKHYLTRNVLNKMHLMPAGDPSAYAENADGSITYFFDPARVVEAPPELWYAPMQKVETQTLEAHTFENWTVVSAATCDASGLKTSSCEECGTVKEEILPATGHKKSSKWEKVSESSCLVAGKEGKMCTVCGDVMEIRNLPVAAHELGGWVTTTPASCLTDGVKTRKSFFCRHGC